MTREFIPGTRRWVVKVGSALVTAEGRGLDHDRIARWSAQIAALRAEGVEVVVVSSGAVAEGMARLGWRSRPQSLSQLQAAASVGQMGLVQAYERSFQAHALHTAQVLLTHEDVAHRRRYLNARNSLLTLIGLGVIPIVNENDSVATEEIRLGDNDTLGALTANLIEAELLVLLTDQEGMYDADPRDNPQAQLIDARAADDPELMRMAGGSSGALGRGGMKTKVAAAAQAARSGASTIIADGRKPDVLLRIRQGEPEGSLLTASGRQMPARKRWILGQRQVKGSVQVDEGAARVLRESGRSLLPVGITGVAGSFARGDLVACIGPDGAELARGLTNYDARDGRLIVGKSSQEINDVLGYAGEAEFIHRDNLVITQV